MSIKITPSGLNYAFAGANTSPANLNDFQTVAFSSFKNRIINGDMRIDQRWGGVDPSQNNTILLVGPNDTGNTIYGPVDRWFYHANTYTSGATKTLITGSQVSVSSTQHNFTKGLYVKLVSYDSLGHSFGVGQRIESDNIVGLIGQNVTLSFWIKTTQWPYYNGTTSPGNFKIKIRGCPSPDNWPSSNIFAANASSSYTNSNLHEFSLTPPTNGSDFAFYSVSFKLSDGYTAAAGNPYPALNGLMVLFEAFGGNSSFNTGANFTLTGVQLEAGTAPSDFEFLPYDLQLKMCQRYCYAIHARNKPGTTESDSLPISIIDANTNFVAAQYQPTYMYEGMVFNFDFPTTMRCVPYPSQFQYNSTVFTKLNLYHTGDKTSWVQIDPTHLQTLFQQQQGWTQSTKHASTRLNLDYRKTITIDSNYSYAGRPFDYVTANCASLTSLGDYASDQDAAGARFWTMIFSSELGQYNKNERKDLGYTQGTAGQWLKLTVSTDSINVRSEAIYAGWDQTSAFTYFIPEDLGVIGWPGLNINGTWPNGITIINRGILRGRGGSGGGFSQYVGLYSSSSGGDAIQVNTTSPVTIYNYGIIAGGGGGGGTGYFTGAFGQYCYSAGGGGAGGGSGGSGWSTNVSHSGGYLNNLWRVDKQIGPTGAQAGGNGGGAGGGGAGVYSGSGGSIFGGGGGAGGTDFPGTGGNGGTTSNYAGGLGTIVGGNGGSGTNAGGAPTSTSYGAGGGGWGAAGASSYNAGSPGGKAIYRMAGASVTLYNYGSTYGAIT